MFRAIRIKHYIAKMWECDFSPEPVLAGSEIKPGNIPSLNEVASLLNCSPGNLRRLLNNEGVRYQRLVNDYRCDLAKEYIKTSSLSNKEIGYLLGYEETKAFLAAFKNWTGMSMSEYRSQSR